MSYWKAVLKRNLELAGMFPFVMLGKLSGLVFPLKTKPSVFLFSPSADFGGSIKVNAEIIDCLPGVKCIVIFSKKPKNNLYRDLFDKKDVTVIDLHRYIDNKWYHFVNFFYRGKLSTWINKTDNPIVIGGESLFFYKVIPHIHKKARVIEICHLNTWFHYSLGFIKYIDERIFSTPGIRRDAEVIYKKAGVPPGFFDKLNFIDNKVDIPPLLESNHEVLEVIFVGRGAPQKRVHLVAEIARKMHESRAPVHFSFVGDVEQYIPMDLRPHIKIYGAVKEKEKLDEIYRGADVLLLTSAYEGLPLVVMDMMARGKVIVSTAVGGIPDYIIDSVNGFLINNQDEEFIVNRSIEKLNLLANDPALRKKMGVANFNYAVNHFSGEKFCTSYRELILGRS